VNTLTEIDYWQQVQGKPRLELERDNIVKRWLEKHLPPSGIRDCVEIGCYPGRYLTIFGERGIELNGIDYVPQVTAIADLCNQHGYRAGKFSCVDFEKDSIDAKFDCVYSLGFIEHFTEWETLLLKHLELVKLNGMLIVETPNFKGWLQRIPRILFDRQNYNRHNLAAMNPSRWESILTTHGFEIVRSDCIGGYQLWFEKKCGLPEWGIRGLFCHFLRVIRRVVYGDHTDHPSFSAAFGLIARRVR
jgi:2-polyprenyl-3-methyl-5-hydroxy-6-metoxy-1,4-benzoquinol methylase